MEYSERIASMELNPWYQEHIARYHKLTDFELGAYVLDIACGSGYGTKFISTITKRALGVDQSGATIAENRKIFSKNLNLDFQTGNAEQLSMATGSFSSVVSFETIEHLRKPKNFLSEIARVLQPDGLFFISTPNALITKPVNGIPKNPFHIKEFTPDELHAVLSEHFQVISMFGQTVANDFPINFFWNPKPTKFINPKYYLWAILHRVSGFASEIAEQLSRKVLKSHLYPRGETWIFSEESTSYAHDIFVVCKKKS